MISLPKINMYSKVNMYSIIFIRLTLFLIDVQFEVIVIIGILVVIGKALVFSWKCCCVCNTIVMYHIGYYSEMLHDPFP